MPSLRMPVTNTSGAGKVQLGAGAFGLDVFGNVELYKSKAEITQSDRIQKKSLYGYFNFEKASKNPNAVFDFARLGDKEVTPNTPIISAPHYTYDVFSISGEGTGGTIRAYRNDLGYVRDNYTRTKNSSWSAGIDLGPVGHYGANFNTVNTPGVISDWTNGNLLRQNIGFNSSNGLYENIYFRNPGEATVIEPSELSKIGGVDLVNYKLGGSAKDPILMPVLQKYKMDGTESTLPSVSLNNSQNPRKKRTQVVTFYSAKEAAEIGIENEIRSYDSDPLNLLNNNRILNYTTSPRIGILGDVSNEFRKAHHISQINVLEADGKRYAYGIPVYNLVQKDITFSINKHRNPDANNHIEYHANENSVNSNSNSDMDWFYQSTITPAYAHSFLLSGLLSPDYVDVTNDGITDDDLGNAVKFNYFKSGIYKWRTPYKDLNSNGNGYANFNDGLRTERKDNKAMITYGERESWYMHTIESKTMIAVFRTSNRLDGKGVMDEKGAINLADNVLKKLDRIDLYSKSDLKSNGISNAKPIKSVHFEYNYELCANTPDNINANTSNANTGKLTLKKIYFTFNGHSRANKNQYVFGYENLNLIRNNVTNKILLGNPNYAYNSSDRWGTYKDQSSNPASGTLNNLDFPYTLQDDNVSNINTTKNKIDAYAGAWALKSILLPSGGQMEIDYEADSYTYVQDKLASTMMQVLGFGNSPSAVPTNKLYSKFPTKVNDNDFVFVNLPRASTVQELKDIYLNIKPGKETQLAFKLYVKMPKGFEYINVYGIVQSYGLVTGNNSRMWVQLKRTKGFSALSFATIDFLRQSLPGQAYPGYDVSENTGLRQVGEMLLGLLDGIKSTFRDPVEYLRSSRKNAGQEIELTKSFVRLGVYNYKYGGGHRVKSITIKDNWDRMTQQFGATYGQEFSYNTINPLTNQEMSSGVATYEPSIGGDENPFLQMLQIEEDRLPAGPANFTAIEMPTLDALFPAPSVGYSKVTVRSQKRYASNPSLKAHSAVGKQVTEYYTAKDFPVKYAYTNFNPNSSLDVNEDEMTAFFYQWSYNAKTQSQGFIVITNDMHGKQKFQSSYSENDENTPINTVKNFYINTGNNGLNDLVQFVNNETGGTITNGNLGIDVELMTDVRQFTNSAVSLSIQGQLEMFLPFPPVWIPFIWPVRGEAEMIYRAVTCTKTVHYHAVLEKVEVVDKGSMVETKNLLYDANTGQVLVTQTNNEFNQPIYNTTYPAYWAYGGMGLAYKNIGAVYNNVSFLNGQIVSGIPQNDLTTIFESGDELYLLNSGSVSTDMCWTNFSTPSSQKLWVFDSEKNTKSGLTNNTYNANNIYFLTENGMPYTKSNVTFKIIRSGKRNLLGASVQTITSLNIPIVANRLIIQGSNAKVTNANAVEYNEKWAVDKTAFKKMLPLYSNPCNINTQISWVENCAGQFNIGQYLNPYVNGLLGNFKVKQSRVLYKGRAEGTIQNSTTNISTMGVIPNYDSYYYFNNLNNLIPNALSPEIINWVVNSTITKFNSAGVELETTNALNISTSALYGYAAKLPIAIANNSKYEEMLNENFEDYSYDTKITGNGVNCFTSRDLKHFDFLKTIDEDSFHQFHTNPKVSIISSTSGSLPVKPHSGTKMLTHFKQTSSNDVAYKINLKNPSINNNFNLNFSSQVLNNTTVSSTPGITLNPGTVCGHMSKGSRFVVALSPSGLYYQQNSSTGQNHSGAFEAFVSLNGSGKIVLSLSRDFTTVVRPPNFEYPRMGVTHISLLDLNGTSISSATNASNFGGSNLCNLELNYPNNLCLNKFYKIKVSFSDYQFYYNNGYYASSNSGILFEVQEPSYSTGNFYGNTLEPFIAVLNSTTNCSVTAKLPIAAELNHINPQHFALETNKKQIFSCWVNHRGTGNVSVVNGVNGYSNLSVDLEYYSHGSTPVQKQTFYPVGPVIDGWQKIEGEFITPNAQYATYLKFKGMPQYSILYIDDIRIHPYNANMKSYVYDPINLRLVAELDENNYAKFYEYDAEGTLIRTKAETKEGIKTITETRSAKQKTIQTIQ